MRTRRMKQLIDEALESLPKPHGEDVIEDVFHAIEGNPAWRKTYDEIVYHLGKPTANAWGGFWVAHADAKIGEPPVPATRGTLLQSYAKLVAPAPKRGKKLKEPEAAKAMHEHYVAHRAALPAGIREQRGLIVTLIMAGIDPESAFAKALEKPELAR